MEGTAKETGKGIGIAEEGTYGRTWEEMYGRMYEENLMEFMSFPDVFSAELNLIVVLSGTSVLTNSVQNLTINA